MATQKAKQAAAQGSCLARAKAAASRSKYPSLSKEEKAEIAAITALSNHKATVLFKDGSKLFANISKYGGPAVRGQKAVLTSEVKLFELPPVDWTNLTWFVQAEIWR